MFVSRAGVTDTKRSEEWILKSGIRPCHSPNYQFQILNSLWSFHTKFYQYPIRVFGVKETDHFVVSTWFGSIIQ